MAASSHSCIEVPRSADRVDDRHGAPLSMSTISSGSSCGREWRRAAACSATILAAHRGSAGLLMMLRMFVTEGTGLCVCGCV